MDSTEEKEMVIKLTRKAHMALMNKRLMVPHIADVTNKALYIFDVECYDISYKGAKHGMLSQDSVQASMDDLRLTYVFGGTIHNPVQMTIMGVYVQSAKG